jgi:hypothetical protein
MRLLMSDSLKADLMLDEALRLLDGLSELACAPDATWDGSEHEVADSTERPRHRCRPDAFATDADP